MMEITDASRSEFSPTTPDFSSSDADSSTRIVLGVYSVVVTVIGVLFNSLAIFILVKGKNLTEKGAKKRIHRLYLAITDLVGALTLPAIMFIQATSSGFHDNHSAGYVAMFAAAEFIRFSCILHHLAIALTVYVSSIYPLKYLVYTSAQKKRYGALVWGVALILSFDPGIVGLMLADTHSGKLNDSTEQLLTEYDSGLLVADKVYYTLKYFIPFLTVILLSIYTTIRVKMGRRNLEQQCRIFGRKFRLAMLTLLKTDGIITTFTWLCWAAYQKFISSRLRLVDKRGTSDLVINAVILINTVTTPVFQFIILPQFKRDAKQITRGLLAGCKIRVGQCICKGQHKTSRHQPVKPTQSYDSTQSTCKLIKDRKLITNLGSSKNLDKTPTQINFL